MNEVITIENTEMQIREYAGQRVVTFKDIDTVHQRPTGTARNAFRRNKQRFEEGKHYFVLKTDEDIGENPNVRLTYIRNIVVPNRGITVLTERGYLMLVKAFTDDLSWQVQDRLVEVYFNAKEAALSHCTPLAPERKVSSVPAPKASNWFAKNQWKISGICSKTGYSKKKVLNLVLMLLSEEYDLDASTQIYTEENGHQPVHAADVINYFPEISERATKIIYEMFDLLYKKGKKE